MPIDDLPPEVLFPFVVIAWTMLLLVTLVSLRRAKVKRDKYRRAVIRSARRETHIQLAEESDPFAVPNETTERFK